MTRDDVLSHLYIFHKPENIDPLQKWIGSYNLYGLCLLQSSNGFFIELEQSDRPNPMLLRIYRNSKERSNLPYIRMLETGKYDLLVSKYYPKFEDFRHVIADYYRTRRFKLNIVKYLSRSVS